MYGSIVIQICAVGSKRRIFSAPESTRVRFGRSRSSKVNDFGTKQKRVDLCDFLLVSNIWFYLAPFLRYGDLLAKNCQFFLPNSHSAPSLPMFPLEFCGEVIIDLTMRKLESWGYPAVQTAWL